MQALGVGFHLLWIKQLMVVSIHKVTCMLMCALENRLGMELAINKVLMSEI